MLNVVRIAGASALLAAGLAVIPGQAAQKPVEPVKTEAGKIVDRLPKHDGMPESRVVRVVYPSPFSPQR